MEYAAPAGAGAGGYYYYPPSQQHKPRRPPRPAARWVKHWIPQDLATSSGKCALYKWVREDVYKNLKDGKAVPEPEAVKPEPTTEILFLCSYENCGKTFVDVAALRKHAHVHNERQYICQEPGCGKVVSPHFAPSSMYHVVCDYLFSSARYITEMFLTNMSASFPPALYPDYFPYFVLSFFFHRISSIVTIQQIASKPYL